MPERWRFVLITLAALIGMAVTLSLGRWQLQRAAYKQELFDAVQRQQGLPPWSNALLAAVQPGAAPNPEAAPWLHRPVQLQGHWIAGQTLYLDNRQMQGQPDPVWGALQARLKQARGPGFERMAIHNFETERQTSPLFRPRQRHQHLIELITPKSTPQAWKTLDVQVTPQSAQVVQHALR